MSRQRKATVASGEAQGAKVMPRAGEIAIGAPMPAQSPHRWITRVTDQWVPIPEALSKELGWVDGTELELLLIMNNQVVVRRKGALSDAKHGVGPVQGQTT